MIVYYDAVEAPLRKSSFIYTDMYMSSETHGMSSSFGVEDFDAGY